MIHDNTLPMRMSERLSEDGCAIYLFHGVIQNQTHPVRNYTGKHIEATLFKSCMKHLAQEGYALTMDEVLGYCESGEALPKRAYAITFDDGFENNLSIAGPILDDLKIPAMIYVASKFVAENGMSWIDRIEWAVEEAPSQFVSEDWALEPFHLSDARSKINFLRAVRRYVKGNPKCDANAYADQLCAKLGRSGPMSSDDPLDLKMTWPQVKMAQSSEVFSIGGHSHTHPILSYLSPEKLAYELDTSMGLLSEMAGIPATHYSYPEGLSHCYTPEVIAQLRLRGVRCCPTAIDGVNKTGADPFNLLRIMVG
jgi:peptidoglycan/xylan/chitin deacetylase (PgdA/CDA1 family)